MNCVKSLITDYELPKVVTVPNKPLGVLKIILHFISLSFVVFYQLYYCRGYQEFSGVDSCLTTKIKGVTGWVHESYKKILFALYTYILYTAVSVTK